MNVLVVSRDRWDTSYFWIFSELGYKHKLSAVPDDLFDISNGVYDLVCLVGGADVNPKYYNEPDHPMTSYTKSSTAMDEFILGSGGVIDTCDKHGVPIVGICKGSQQLCVHQGGRLHQHVDFHGNHNLVDLVTNECFYTNGGHHQVVDLTGVKNSIVLAEPPESISGLAIREPDVVYYPEINAIGFQFHPEWGAPGSTQVQYFHKKLKEVLDEGILIPVLDTVSGI